MDVKTSSRRTSRSKPRSSSAKDTLAGAVVPGGFLVGLSTGVLLGGGAERVALGAVGAASAAAGALVAKALTESSSWTATGHGSQCLSEIRKSLHLAVVPGVPFGDLVRQLLKAVDWMLSVEASRGDLASSARGFLGLDAVDGEASAPEPAVSRAGRCEKKELRKHLRRLTALCASEPLLTHQRPCRPKRRSKVAPDFIGGVQREEAVAAALFNPKRNVVRELRGLGASLCFLVGAVLRHRAGAQRWTSQASERASLRLAVTALAQHPLLDPEDDGIAVGSYSVEEVTQFRQGALALLCILDGALAWTPLDPMGWLGACKDSVLALVVGMPRVCAYPQLAMRLRVCLKKAAGACPATWRRLRVYFDMARATELPEPWPRVWLQSQDSSMLVRNLTKVPLRVELHRADRKVPSPWGDLPLIKALRRLTGFTEERLVFSELVGPGIEWALRPRACEGQHFQMKLLTQAGVVVSSRRLRRGQTFDFEVPVPQCTVTVGPPARKVEELATRTGSAIDIKDEKGKHRHSLCSTVAPSTASRLSTSTCGSMCSPLPSPGAMSGMSSLPAAVREVDDEAQDSAWEPCAEDAPATDRDAVDSLEVALCPRCLRRMVPRLTCPSFTAYAEGVQCDNCGTELLKPGHHEQEQVKSRRFFHCQRCWFDLCGACALQDMTDVWWNCK